MRNHNPTQTRTARIAACAVMAAATLATGCAGVSDPLTAIGIPPLQKKDGAQAARGPIGPETPEQQNARIRALLANRPVQAPDVCKSEEFMAPVDVDTAYARVMSRLQFRTMGERQFRQQQNSLNVIDENFRHVAQAGAFYRMTDHGTISEPGAPRERAWLNMELAREGANRTKVLTGFCMGANDKFAKDEAHHARLFRVMREAVLR